MSNGVAEQAEAAYQRAFASHQQGRLEEARSGYDRVLQLEPRHAEALTLLGILALQTDDPRTALELLGKSILIDPENAVAYVNHAGACAQLGRHEAAIESYDKAIALNTECDAIALYSRGNALNLLKRYEAAIASYDQAIALESEHDADAYYGRGIALQELERYAAAVASYDQAIALNCGYQAEAYFGRGVALQCLQQHAAAVSSYDSAIALKPDNSAAHGRRGTALQALRQFEAAVASYDRAIALTPMEALPHKARGVALHELKRHDAAIASLDKALALAPDDAEAHNNRGIILAELRQFGAAVASFDRALALRSDYADAFRNRGVCLVELHEYKAAIASFERAGSLNAAIAGLAGMRLGAKMQICDWRGIDSQLEGLADEIEKGEAASPPFNFLALSSSARLQRKCAENWGRRNCPANSALPPPQRIDERPKIRIGYFSADFREHATLYLMAGLFELHDRSRFELTAFSFGPDLRDAMRTRLTAACPDFHDVRGKSDLAIATLARQLQIDIAVDLNGFTHNARPGVFALRAAPLQVSYLGYPGTMGVDYIDYLVADRTLIPDPSRQYYSEQIVYLPHSYQVNDSKRPIDETRYAREALGLPARGFVFCCFNNSYKIKPDVFDCWMRILRRVESAVLWLFADNPSAQRNLRREAERRGVNAGRLIFAQRVAMPAHLARHRAADLFIDTFPYTAHTTASDALWAGLPVLTRAGESFASRVAASLLRAIDLPELITESPVDYEELAVELAEDPHRLARIGQRLAENRLSAPLFDTALTTRHLESAYTAMVRRHRANLPASHMHVEA
jgi:protein O-GlcNAc transferase